jgi:hypothetical protein
MVPRSEWDQEGEIGNDLRLLFDRDGFNAETFYCLMTRLQHPGSEAWPAHISQRFFTKDAAAMDLRVAALAWQSASSPGKAVQVDPMKRVLKAPGTNSRNQIKMNRFQCLLSNTTCAATTR